jgi:response regulator RpfG family c-di-GMP phosphodiesterase
MPSPHSATPGEAVRTLRGPFARRKRAGLIGAILALQAGVIGLGGYITLREAQRTLSTRVEETAANDNARSCSNFAGLLRSEVSEPFSFGSAEWERVQARVETFEVVSGGQLVVLDAHGRVLCHPQLRSNPGLRTLDISAQVLQLASGEMMEMSRLSPYEVTTGVSESLSGRASVAVLSVPELGVKVVVHQPEASLSAARARVNEVVLLWVGASGVVLLGVSLVGSSVIMRRYDSALERMNKQLEAQVERRTRAGLAIRNGLIFGLAKLADYRDTDTGRHLERICRYCTLLAEELRTSGMKAGGAVIDAPWIERLRLASSMHDIGKVGIHDSILLKPGRLTPDERRQMEMHPVIGADTLIAIRRHVGHDDLLDMGIEVTLSHHEHWDGTGYPFGLVGEQIPIAARIVALADMYDALTSKRVYKRAYGHDEAVKMIAACAGTKFDPRVVEAFERVQARFNDIRSEMLPDDFCEVSRLKFATDRARAVSDEYAGRLAG